MNNTYKKYINEFMPSDEMRNYLKTQELTPYQLASLIFNSPYSIDQKKNAFYSLLSETDNSELKALCSNCIENIEKAYELLNTGGVFKVTSNFINGVVPELNDEGLFAKYDDVKEFIASDIKECEYEDYDYYSYFVEKWIKNSNGKLGLVVTYYVIKNEICYFKYSPVSDYLKEFLQGFEPKILGFELNVPTPFEVGDVVMFDGYPFAKRRFSLILSTGDNQDCCSLWNLYWAGPRTWKTGAVKHGRVGYVLRNDFIVPPLYNAKRYDGVLPSTFKIFHEIKQAFGDDEQKYYELDSFVSARGITEDEIQNFIKIQRWMMESFNMEFFANDLESEVGLTLVGGRLGVGKTAFLLNVTAQMLERNKNVFFVSLELGEESVKNYLLSTGLNNQDSLSKLAIYDKPNFNIDDLSDDETAVNSDLIIIDYLNLISYANDKSLDYIVKQLKNISNHKNINIIATTQLSKGNDESRIPTESDFMISEDVFSKYVDNSILLYEK